MEQTIFVAAGLIFVAACLVFVSIGPSRRRQAPAPPADKEGFSLYFDDHGNGLPCYGCAHSAAVFNSEAGWPGKPAGERPCMFCIRNVDRERWVHSKTYNYPEQWNDGTPLSKAAPLDMYVATDRMMEERNLRRIAGERGHPVHATIEDKMDAYNQGLRDWMRRGANPDERKQGEVGDNPQRDRGPGG